MAPYALLDEINVPSDLRNLKENDLPLLARELREELISIVSKTCLLYTSDAADE